MYYYTATIDEYSMLSFIHSFQTLTQNHRGFLFEKRKTIAMRKSIIVFFFFLKKILK